jgi:rare lipoprotein A
LGVFVLIPLGACALGACSQGGRAPDPQLGVTASPRVVAGRAVPKGGGVYKVGKPYEVAGRRYVPREVAHYDRSGVASWYGKAFHGRRTANGEIYDMYALTAGHPTLPLPSYAYVTNLDNGRTILVRINDRGPYVNNRLIDLSWRSAHELGYSRRGLARARVRYAGRAPLNGNDAAERRHLAAQSWYRGNLNVAQMPSSDISTGAIGSSETAPAWSVGAYRQQRNTAAADAPEMRPATLGGPARLPVDAGSFATLAEAERMRHELADVGPVVVEQVGFGTEASFRVRVVPRGNISDAASAGSGRIRAAVEGGK